MNLLLHDSVQSMVRCPVRYICSSPVASRLLGDSGRRVSVVYRPVLVFA